MQPLIPQKFKIKMTISYKVSIKIKYALLSEISHCKLKMLFYVKF
jgi:hypothetical protein